MTDLIQADANFVTFSGVFVHITVNGRLYRADELGLKAVTIIDSDEGDSTVEFSCIDNDFKVADNLFFREGAVLDVRWGYTNPRVYSETRSGYVIMKPSTKYAEDGVVSTIKAKTKSASLHAHRPQRAYGPTSLATIVKDIVSKAGLKLDMATGSGTEQLPGFSQGNWSDRQTLRVLAERFGYQVSYLSDTVVFKPLEYDHDPKVLLRYGRGGNVKSANVNNDTHSDAGASSKVMERGFDPKAKVPMVQSSQTGDNTGATLGVFAATGHSWLQKATGLTPATPSGNSTSAGTSGKADPKASPLPKVVSSNPTGGTTVGNTSDGEEFDAEKLMVMRSSPETVEATLKAHADATRLKHKKRKAGLTIDSLGIPMGHARMIVTVEGLAKRDSGNWRVSKVTHKIDVNDSTYTCHWELNRPGKGVGSRKEEGKPNTKPATGSKNLDSQVQVSAISGGVKK